MFVFIFLLRLPTEEGEGLLIAVRIHQHPGHGDFGDALTPLWVGVLRRCYLMVGWP